jgi:hypothetical protein
MQEIGSLLFRESRFKTAEINSDSNTTKDREFTTRALNLCQRTTKSTINAINLVLEAIWQ